MGRQSLKDRALEELRAEIFSRKLRVGDIYSEEQLLDRLRKALRQPKLSRTPVGQAIAVLVRQGMFEPVHTRGYRIRLITDEDCLAAIMLRAAVEMIASTQLARLRDARPALDLSELRSILDEQATTKSLKRFLELGALFHRKIWCLCGFGATVDLLDALWLRSTLAYSNKLPLAAAKTLPSADQDEIHEQHAKILQAIEAGDSRVVAAAVCDHFEGQLRRTGMPQIGLRKRFVELADALR